MPTLAVDRNGDSGATSGAIGITTPGGTATSSSSFSVSTATSAPAISGFSPTKGPWARG